MSSIDPLIASWRASAELHKFREGATEAEIGELEILVNRKLPAEWRDLYLFSNGVTLFNGNLEIYPLRGRDWSLDEASDSFRNSDWPIPEELWLAGNNGQGDQLGLWLPGADPDAAPVVGIGPNFGGVGALQVQGSSLSRFLLANSAFHLLSAGGVFTAGAVAELKVPPAVRSKFPEDAGSWDAGWSDPDGDAWTAVSQWADPECPSGLGPCDVKDINEALGVE